MSRESGDIREYIEASWETLSRSWDHLVEAADDPKLGELQRYPVFVSSGENLEQIREVVGAVLSPQEMARIEWRVLPEDVKTRPQLEGGIEAHGLLFLPHPYVVPGGRFNEMYGWDSHFINLGLLASERVEQARQMADNHLYQVEQYGRVLNANRSYYLTRSQPPFLATTVADVYRQTRDLDWLRRALPALESTYGFWTSEPHLTPSTGLSRYYDLGHGPAVEVEASEKDEAGLTHYDRIRDELKALIELPAAEVEQSLGYPLDRFYDRSTDRLTEEFYRGDRSMRESGYDPSDRFGRFNADVVSYNPVDLNSLLYLYEKEMAWLAQELGEEASQNLWDGRAKLRAEAMSRYLWDDEQGLFFDYNVRTERRRAYPFATTFFPLWTGWATPQQAAGVHDHLASFLRLGGLLTSHFVSGNQWDAPFGWAPLQLAAVEGLERYGYSESAKKVASAFLTMVEAEFARTGTIVEKYDVERASADVSADIAFGYSSNEIGFGWTNAVYLKLKRAYFSTTETA